MLAITIDETTKDGSSRLKVVSTPLVRRESDGRMYAQVSGCSMVNPTALLLKVSPSLLKLRTIEADRMRNIDFESAKDAYDEFWGSVDHEGGAENTQEEIIAAIAMSGPTLEPESPCGPESVRVSKRQAKAKLMVLPTKEATPTSGCVTKSSVLASASKDTKSVTTASKGNGAKGKSKGKGKKTKKKPPGRPKHPARKKAKSKKPKGLPESSGSSVAIPTVQRTAKSKSTSTRTIQRKCNHLDDKCTELQEQLRVANQALERQAAGGAPQPAVVPAAVAHPVVDEAAQTRQAEADKLDRQQRREDRQQEVADAKRRRVLDDEARAKRRRMEDDERQQKQVRLDEEAVKRLRSETEAIEVARKLDQAQRADEVYRQSRLSNADTELALENTRQAQRAARDQAALHEDEARLSRGNERRHDEMCSDTRTSRFRQEADHAEAMRKLKNESELARMQAREQGDDTD